MLLYAFALMASLLSIWSVTPLLRLTAFAETSMLAVAVGFALCYALTRPAFTRRAAAWAIAGAAGAFALWQCIAALAGGYAGESLLATPDRAMLVVIFDNTSNLGLVRYRVRAALEELIRVFFRIDEKLKLTDIEPLESPFEGVSDEDIDRIFGD